MAKDETSLFAAMPHFIVSSGILMVGGADFMVQSETGGVSDAVIGDIIVVCAQVRTCEDK